MMGNKKDNGMTEETKMDHITTAMLEHICNHICWFSWEVSDQEEMDRICADCQMNRYLTDILNTYSQLNDFEKSNIASLLKKYAEVVFCEECEYCKTKKAGIRWCRLSQGLDMDLKPGTGCTRGRKRETDEITASVSGK